MTDEKENNIEQGEKKSGVSRREFISGAVGGVIVGTAAAGALGLPRAVSAQTLYQPPAPANWNLQADVVVAGAGVGGLTAALSAQQAGAKVICVEAYSQVGGTGRDSGGGVISPDNLADAMLQMPYGDSTLIDVFVNNMPNAAALLLGTGAPGTKSATGLSTYMTTANFTQEGAFFDAVANAFTSRGGTLLLNTKAVQLYTNGAGTITGVQAVSGGVETNIGCKAVILATGGFQNNPDLKSRYYGTYGSTSLAAIPTNDGTGLLMAEQIGAKLSKGLGTFYGHHLPASPPATVSWGDYWTNGAHQNYDGYSIMINLDGERYFNESPPPTYSGFVDTALLAQQTLQQRYGRACIIFDQAIYNAHGYRYPGQVGDLPGYAKSHGGHVASASTLQDLATAITAWGYNGYQMLNTVTEFNAAVDAGTTAQLVPPKTQAAYISKISTPPFWAVEVCVAIYCCYGGLCIDNQTRVLKEGDVPIPGLYATVGTAGGITEVNYYYSSQGACAAFGYVAGQNAAAYAQ